MKLSKLYTNQPAYFTPIIFNSGLNAILGEIKTTAEKDTHNLGKSLLVQIIDFCLLKKKDRFVLLGVEPLQEFVFFLEIELEPNNFLTIARSLNNATRANFKYHSEPNQDFRGLLDDEWSQFNLPFNTAKTHLDSLLKLNFLGDYSYRRFIGYLLRSQADFNDPFQLAKNKGKDSYWKPILAKLLGFNDTLISRLYEKKIQLEKMRDKQKALLQEAGSLSKVKSLSDVEGEIEVIENRINSIEAQLAALNFGEIDKDAISVLVDNINEQISYFNDQLFYAETNEKKLKKSLEENTIIFNPDDAQALFSEAGIIFDGQIKKEFSDLIQFHQAISNERSEYLKQELLEITQYIKDIKLKLSQLNQERAEKLSFLSDRDIFDKYKRSAKELVEFKAKLLSLEKTKEVILEKELLQNQIVSLNQECEGLEADIRSNVNDNVQGDTTFSKIRQYFSQIIRSTLNKDAYLTVNVNTEGNLIFEYKFSGTQEHLGHTYKKLLCIAFDMALARTYIEQGYSLFLFHDGIFESLDDRVKERLLNVVREYSEYGLQQIITLIDSEVPNKQVQFIADSEIALTLHDKDDSGRLFKMPAW